MDIAASALERRAILQLPHLTRLGKTVVMIDERPYVAARTSAQVTILNRSAFLKQFDPDCVQTILDSNWD